MRVLAIDGGGIAASFRAVLLAELERRAKRPVAELFDLIAGTSTGGILAAALTVPGRRAAAADGRGGGRSATSCSGRASSIARCAAVTSPTACRRALRQRRAEAALGEQLGDALLSQTLTDVLLTAYDLDDAARGLLPHVARQGRPGDRRALADAVLATAVGSDLLRARARPRVAGGETHTLVDGGVFATNPRCARWPRSPRMGRLDEVARRLARHGLEDRPDPYEQARNWGRLEWAQPILDVVFDGVADTVDFQVQQLLPDGSYHRFQIELPRNIALDDARPATIDRAARARRAARPRALGGHRRGRQGADDPGAALTARAALNDTAPAGWRAPLTVISWRYPRAT